MYDLTDCSIIIPVHIDSKERQEHVRFLLDFFNRYFINHHLLILEQGKESKVQISQDSKTRLILIKSEEVFSTAKLSNMGAQDIKTSFFCKCDADALLHPKAFFDAFERLKRSNATLVLPYNGVSFTVEEPLRKKMMEHLDINTLPFFDQKECHRSSYKNMRLKNDDSTGLVHHFRTSVFKELGGYNEEFIGWGYEDDELMARFEKLNHPKVTLDNYIAFHLDHPRKLGDPIQVFKNYYRWQTVKNMSATELMEYTKTWNRFEREVFRDC